MTAVSTNKIQERILILTPIGQDAAVAHSVFGRVSLDSYICTNVAELGKKFEEGAGVILISEEALNPETITTIKEKTGLQPAWSDIPIILLTNRSHEKKTVEIFQAFGMNANVHLLERTFRPVTLVSLVQVALRARRRQYEVRDLLNSLKQSEENLKKSAQELNQSNKELEHFAYIASHDLQEPVRMVANYADLLRVRCENKLDNDEKTYLGYAIQGAERARHMIKSLLEFSQVGNKYASFKVIVLDDVIRTATENLKLALEESQACLEIQSLPKIRGDMFQMIQLFQNLIGNAVKYRSEASPRISVSAQMQDEEWVFTVQDNGIGISPEYHQKIFELFQRLHPKDKYQGAGLGLAICKKIVELHGGRIWIESEVQKGSKFRFTLPALQEEALLVSAS